MAAISFRTREFLFAGHSGSQWHGVFVVPKAYLSRMVSILDRQLNHVPLECSSRGEHGQRYGYAVLVAELKDEEGEPLSPSDIADGCKALQKACRLARSDFLWCDFCDFFPLRKFVSHDPARANVLFGTRLVDRVLRSREKGQNQQE